MNLEIRGRDDSWHVHYPNEERLSSPVPVYDKEGNYKETLYCGSATAGNTEAHFTGTKEAAIEYAHYLFPGCEVTVTRLLNKQESLKRARQATKTRRIQ